MRFVACDVMEEVGAVVEWYAKPPIACVDTTPADALAPPPPPVVVVACLTLNM